MGIGAVISVDCLDMGTDQIKLRWHNASAVQSAALTKSNTRQWRAWTLSLAGMDLTNRFASGSTSWDFRLWDNGDGIERIGSVRFQPVSSGIAPATPTLTATRTVATLRPPLRPRPSRNRCAIDW